MNKDAKTYLEREFGTVTALIRLHAQEPSHVALKLGQTEVTYAQLDKLLDRVAGTLQSIGQDSRVALCAEMSIEYVVAYLGALRAGVSVVPLPASATEETLSAMLDDSGATLTFVDLSTRSKIKGLVLHLEELESWAREVPFNPVEITPTTEFAVMYSSGTTGIPKGVVQRHSMRWALAQRGHQFEYDENSVAIVSTPMYSSATGTVFFTTLAFGGKLVLMPKFSAKAFLQLAEANKVTHAILVPVQYQRLLSEPTFDKTDLSSFKYKFCTSAPFSLTLKSEVLRRWPGGLVEFYGMTEGGGTCILEAHKHPEKLHTVGKPAPKHEVRLIDDSGNEVAQGQVGEVVGRSAVMMDCYLNQPEKTAQAEWFDSEGRRFIRSGDIGKFDEDGFLILLDRKKDLIISGGFNIYPSDLEEKLWQYPGVTDVAVVGVPSVLWGETPVAFVVGDSLDIDSVKTWINERVSNLHRVSDVVLMLELPRNPGGKVIKTRLRYLYPSLKAKASA